MLTISEEDYRELQRITRLRKAGKISNDHFRKLTGAILAPLQREEEVRKEREELRKAKEALRKEFRKKLRDIDAAYGKHRGVAVQGGLPSLGKRK
jgi:hypothetical protein